MRRRAAARRNVHVDEAITAVGIIGREQNGISVSHDAEVAKALVFVRVRNRKIAAGVVRRNRGDGLRCDRFVIHSVDFSSWYVCGLLSVVV